MESGKLNAENGTQEIKRGTHIAEQGMQKIDIESQIVRTAKTTKIKAMVLFV